MAWIERKSCRLDSQEPRESGLSVGTKPGKTLRRTPKGVNTLLWREYIQKNEEHTGLGYKSDLASVWVQYVPTVFGKSDAAIFVD